MSLISKKSQEGQTLIEVMVAIVLLSLVLIPFVLSLNNLNRHFTKLATLAQAEYYTKRNIEITNTIVEDNWPALLALAMQEPVSQPFHLELQSGNWQLISGTDKVGAGFDTQIRFEFICRTDDFEEVNCLDTEAKLDTNTLKVVSTTEWDASSPRVVIETMFTYLF